MTWAGLLGRNLLYHRRGNLAVLLGVAIGTAVLSGALLVGDSLRGSLRERGLRQLAWVDHALVAGRFFRAALADDLPADRVAPALLLQGAASHDTGDPDALPRRVGRITILGVDARFWQPSVPLSDAFWQAATPEQGGVVLSEPLARELQVSVGDTVSLHLQKASAVPRETLLGRRDTEAVLSRLSLVVRAVLGTDEPGAGFSLTPSVAVPRNAFVPLPLLQAHLEQPGRANALLASGGEAAALQAALHKRMALDDWGLVLRGPTSRTADLFARLDRNGDGVLAANEWGRRVAESFATEADSNRDRALSRDEVRAHYRQRHDYLSLESRQLLLEPAVATAAEKAAAEAGLRSAPTLVYLANRIAAGGQEIPYSVVAALDPGQSPPLGPFLPPGAPSLADDEVLLVDWKESPLRVPPGDAVTLTYFEPVEGGQLHEKTATFRFRGLVPLTGPADDPDLTPEFPGITDKLELSEWAPPFPYDSKRLKPRDDRYWRQYRTTPKAYVTLARGQQLWGSRFGSLTSVRLAPSAGHAEAAAERFRESLLASLTPEKGGLLFEPVRQRAQEASAGSADFGGLFLGFSFFLIVAALLLVGLLFRLNLDRRASEIGLLLATGYRQRSVRRLLLIEGTILAMIGGLIGTGLAVLYARLLLDLLRALWPTGSELSFLQPHVTLTSLVIGFAATLLMSLLTVFGAVRGLRKVPPRALLAGTTQIEEPTASRPRRRWLPAVAVVCGLVGLALLPLGMRVRDHEAQAGMFFGSGALLLTAALLGVWLGLKREPRSAVGGHGAAALVQLGVRNAGRAPSRSLLTAGLLASAAFLLVAVESFRRSAGADYLAADSGSGGFALIAESDVPLFHALDSDKGRAEILDAVERRLRDPEKVRAAGAVLERMTSYALRVRAGDDASCLNLYQPQKPRLLGVPASLIERGGFHFTETLPLNPDEAGNPWRLLHRPLGDDVIPVIGEANTVKWILKRGLGDEIESSDERGRPVRLRIVGLLGDSVFQSGLLMSEANFLRLFPSAEGYSFFLIDPHGEAERVAGLLELGLGERGFEVTPSQRRLEAYLAVENTYLSTFQALGGLGLFLGTLGLAVVLLRSIGERRGELALLRALGYRHRALGWLLLAENGFLLVIGLGIGAVTALLSVLPHLASGEGSVPWLRLLGMLLLVLATGLLTGAAALAAALRAPLIPALRRE